MRKIIFNSAYEETVRSTVLTALGEIENRENEVKDREIEVKDREIDVLRVQLEVVTLKNALQSSAWKLRNVLNANSLLSPLGFIGEKYFFALSCP